MARHRDFVVQLKNFEHEAFVAAQYLYSEVAVKHAASKSKKLLSRLNETPRFWRAHSAACQTAAYICIGRIFDQKSKYNLDALLNSFEENLSDFSRNSLAKRKIEGREEAPI